MKVHIHRHYRVCVLDCRRWRGATGEVTGEVVRSIK